MAGKSGCSLLRRSGPANDDRWLMIRACRKPRRITRRDMPLCADHDAATWLKAFDRASCLASSPPPRTVAASLHWCAASCREPRPCMGVGQRRGRGHSQLPAGPPLHLVAILPHARRCDAGAVSDRGNCERFNPPHALHPIQLSISEIDRTLFPFLEAHVHNGQQWTRRFFCEKR
jgi:hypothetical protein